MKANCAFSKGKDYTLGLSTTKPYFTFNFPNLPSSSDELLFRMKRRHTHVTSVNAGRHIKLASLVITESVIKSNWLMLVWWC